jgi:DNA-binding MarR family transcriptional regulator
MGLTAVEIFILYELYQDSTSQPSSLARAVGRAATSFSPNLDALENKGLVTRVQDPNPGDRRVVNIALTAIGEEIEEDVTEIVQGVEEQIRSMFHIPEHYYIFVDGLTRLQKLT